MLGDKKEERLAGLCRVAREAICTFLYRRRRASRSMAAAEARSPGARRLSWVYGRQNASGPPAQADWPFALTDAPGPPTPAHHRVGC